MSFSTCYASGEVHIEEPVKEELKEVKISTDKYQRLVVKYDGKFRFYWGVNKECLKTHCHDYYKKAVINDAFIPNKKYHYELYDDKTNEKFVGTFKCKRRYPITNSKKKILSIIADGLERRQKIIGVYTTKYKAFEVERMIKKNGISSLLGCWSTCDSCTQRFNGRAYRLYKLDVEKFSMSKKVHKKYFKALRKITRCCKGSPRKRVCKLNKWFVRHCKYDYSYKKYDGRHAVLNRKAVCNGFSEAFCDACRIMNIPCKLVRWHKVNHAWNIVRVGKRWYHVDCTWDVCTKYGKHLLIGRNDKTFNKKHKIDSKFYKVYVSKSKFGKHNLSTKC